jgi:hypothetical protein
MIFYLIFFFLNYLMYFFVWKGQLFVDTEENKVENLQFLARLCVLINVS